MKNIIINGFDRCGSSMICRVLAKHPDVSMLFQPTNSTEIHKDLFRYWHPEEVHDATYSFFSSLIENKLDKNYIKSIWFDKYSKLKSGASINLIKETKCHLKIEWLRYNFPDIIVYGIWRDPKGILCSLVRNNFHEDWYKTHLNTSESAHIKVIELLKVLNRYSEFEEVYNLTSSSIDKMAFVISVMVQLMAEKLQPTEWLIYEDIVLDPNKFYNLFLGKFGLPYYDFNSYMKKPYNVSGHMDNINPFIWKTTFSKKQVDKLDILFNNLYCIAKE